MDSFSTINLLMNIYTTVFDLRDEMTDIRIAKAAISYPMIDESATNAVMPNLPAGFSEHCVVLLDRQSPRAHLSFAFHENKLVNFNVQVFPKEWFKCRAIKQALNSRLLPYIAAKTKAEWSESAPFGLINEDSTRRLIHNIRMSLTRPISVSASMIDQRFV